VAVRDRLHDRQAQPAAPALHLGPSQALERFQDAFGPARPVPEAVQQGMHDCVARIGRSYHQVVTYQPGERYWTFQWWELSLFLLVSVLLYGYVWYRLHRAAPEHR
jgi:hypothetical protein